MQMKRYPQKVDAPSQWALFDVQMANVYKLGGQANYQQFLEQASGAHLSDVQESLFKAFEVTGKALDNSNSSIARKDVIQGLYYTIQEIIAAKKALPKQENSIENALKYFVEKELINGKLNGSYALEDPSSKQELLIFAKRIYEDLVYTLDMDSKGAFWKVSDEDNTVYLLGSIHVTDGSVYPMSKSIMNAYSDSEVLAAEANILSIQQDVAYIQQKIMLEGAATIDQIIAKETYDAYVKVVQPLGIAPEVYTKLKPWYAAMLLQSVQIANTSYQASLGIDLYFLSKVQAKKPIVELEGTRFQIDMFDSFSTELQEQYLLDVLNGEETDTKEAIGKIVSTWKTGKTDELEQLLFSKKPASDIEKELDDKIWQTRNNNMSDKVLKMLREDSKNDYFVVVGAGHMLNDTGIVKQLLNKGYKVEQIK